MITKLFVYGGLMSSEIRRYKNVRVRAVRNACLRGYKIAYERRVPNCAHSKYHVPNFPTDHDFGMLNLKESPRSRVWGKILYLNKRQLNRVRVMEPGYDLVEVDGDRGLVTLMCFDPQLLSSSLIPNPVYRSLVEKEIRKVSNSMQNQCR